MSNRLLIGDWQVIDPMTEGASHPCRFGAGPGHPSCRKVPTAAKLFRGGATPWWYYCLNHVRWYGNDIRDGEVVQVVRAL